jgi:hypothetical protein
MVLKMIQLCSMNCLELLLLFNIDQPCLHVQGIIYCGKHGNKFENSLTERMFVDSQMPSKRS